MSENEIPRLYDEKRAAEILGVSPTTLTTWRSTRRYDLPFVKIGNAVRYEERDLLAFIERGRVQDGEADR